MILAIPPVLDLSKPMQLSAALLPDLVLMAGAMVLTI